MLIFSSCPGLSRASTSSFSRAVKTWMAGTGPAMTDEVLCKIDQAEPVGGERRLGFALDLDADVGARQQFGRLAQSGFGQREAAAHARAGTHRREEAQFVEAVIDAHGGAFDYRHHLIRHDGE